MKKSKRGAPTKHPSERRTEKLQVRLTKIEKQTIDRQSDNPSEWARGRLLDGLEVK